MVDSILDGELKGVSFLLKVKVLVFLLRYICFEEIELSKLYFKEFKRFMSFEEVEVVEVFIEVVDGSEVEVVDKLLNKLNLLNYFVVFMFK